MEQIEEQLSLSQLKDKINNMKERGFTTTHIFQNISNGWQYGTLILPYVRTLAQLREIINEAYHGFKIVPTCEGAKPQAVLF